jgi:hypothetical protein
MLSARYYPIGTIIELVFCPKGMLIFLGQVGQGKSKINVCACLRASAVEKE